MGDGVKTLVKGFSCSAAPRVTCVGVTQSCLSPVFNKSRGHAIERTNYIQDLQKRALRK